MWIELLRDGVTHFAIFFVNTAFIMLCPWKLFLFSFPFVVFLSELRHLLGKFLCADCHIQQSLSFGCLEKSLQQGALNVQLHWVSGQKKSYNFSSLSNPWLLYLDSGKRWGRVGGLRGEGGGWRNVCYQGLDWILCYWGEISNEVRKKSFVQAAAEQRGAGAWVGWLGLEMDFAF